MAARDNVLFGAPIPANTPAGTVIPLGLVTGVEAVRQGYGSAKLKNARAFFAATYSNDSIGIPVRIKNSNWVDSAGLVAQKFSATTTLNKNSLGFMRGRDKALQPNTSWIIEADIPVNTITGYIWVLLEIEYSDVAGLNPEGASGSPVIKRCKNSAVTGRGLIPVNIGSFDNLLPGVTYVLSEISAQGLSSEGSFVIIEGFSNQKGLLRIIPVKSTGLCDQIEGSVYLTMQTYNMAVLNYTDLTASPVELQFEYIASSN